MQQLSTEAPGGGLDECLGGGGLGCFGGGEAADKLVVSPWHGQGMAL